jgi:hypothetical protein
MVSRSRGYCRRSFPVSGVTRQPCITCSAESLVCLEEHVVELDKAADAARICSCRTTLVKLVGPAGRCDAPDMLAWNGCGEEGRNKRQPNWHPAPSMPVSARGVVDITNCGVCQVATSLKQIPAPVTQLSHRPTSPANDSAGTAGPCPKPHLPNSRALLRRNRSFQQTAMLPSTNPREEGGAKAFAVLSPQGYLPYLPTTPGPSLTAWKSARYLST